MLYKFLALLCLSIIILAGCGPANFGSSWGPPTPTPPPGFFNVDSLIPGQRLHPPSLNSDGKLLAAFGNATLETTYGHLYIVDLETRHLLFTSSEEHWASAPALSSDGSLVAASRYTADKAQIYLVNWRTNHTSYLADGYLPTWSPDGQRLAYAGDTHQPGSPERLIQVRLYDFFTEDETVIFEVNRPWGSIRNLTWFPDGNRLAFIAVLDIQLDNQGMIIPGTDDAAFYTMIADGSNLQTIAEVPFDFRIFNFSPDSEKVLYTALPDSMLTDRVLQVSGMDSRCHRLESPISKFDSAILSPHGNKIAFVTYYGVLVANTSLVFEDDFWEVGKPCELPWP